VYIVAYVAIVGALYYGAVEYGPDVVLRLTTMGWITIEGVPFCEFLSMPDCKDACACKICLGPPPAHVNIATAHTWRGIAVTDPCRSDEAAAAEGCTQFRKSENPVF
jgi:hypothetical protein